MAKNILGCSLVFSYSGQSIPNRLDVKKEKGVKIYFDAIETAARVKQVAAKVLTLFEEAQTEVLDRFQPDAVEQLVWHVAAHEVRRSSLTFSYGSMTVWDISGYGRADVWRAL